VGWKTLLVANLAEASSRRGGHVYHLETADGRAVTGLEQAERYIEEQIRGSTM
jgi:hypothetical protein